MQKSFSEQFKKIKKTPYSVIAFLTIFIALILFELFAIDFSSIILILIGAVLGICLFSLPKKEGDE